MCLILGLSLSTADDALDIFAASLLSLFLFISSSHCCFFANYLVLQIIQFFFSLFQ